ncbi:thermonuclease family protein [Acinetobacter pragensis]|uniref:Nuclease n=1 Tax=Acinetobacter pragensis TaxID=1806892 RepID=A0A151Y469_9GAMM|nr:thermonuclease family protein [Acinetobacter pragensis]KYQ72818.1 nuclease [Acinetobacter pragensis]
MLSNLSSGWLIALGMLLCIVLLFICHKIYIFLTELFKPFKKGRSYWCRVIQISDGDTLTCTRLNIRRSKTKLRFAYVDAPESSQTYGKESQRVVKALVYKKLVRVKITDVDRYGRCVGVIYRYRRNVNEEMVKRGAAWVYEEYIRDKKQLQHMKALQEKAKKQKKGLWKNSRPMRPKEYRKLNK